LGKKHLHQFSLTTQNARDHSTNPGGKVSGPWWRPKINATTARPLANGKPQQQQKGIHQIEYISTVHLLFYP